ncbi:MAG: hypothetical protein N2559_09035 [Anaerolineae bacterium]|nr:hypothetical protein [Anaerolineae bacterium]
MPDPIKPRPIDALFGDENAAVPNYVVEPAQPATFVTPPPPDTNPARAPDIVANTETPMPPPPTLETDTEINALLTNIPLPTTEESEDRFTALGERIERLYSEVKIDLPDSKLATEYCFNLLRQARQAVEARDYARAEFFIQLVDAKLKRSQRSIKATRGIGMIFLWVWQLIMLGAGGGLIAMTYVVNLTLFGLPVAPDFIVLLRAMGWGMLGSVIGAFYNLPRAIVWREFDSAYTSHYVARPFVGALLGALLFLLSQAGIVAGTLVIGDVKVGPIFLYVFAFLVGFKQEYVGEFFEGVRRRKTKDE